MTKDGYYLPIPHLQSFGISFYLFQEKKRISLKFSNYASIFKPARLITLQLYFSKIDTSFLRFPSFVAFPFLAPPL